MQILFSRLGVLLCACLLSIVCRSSDAADWPQLLGNSLRSGDAAAAALPTSLEITAAIPLTDAALSSPVIRDAFLVLVDASGVVHAIETRSKQILWRFSTEGGAGNCNNVASPAIIDGFVHVGTMSGFYYVLELASGRLVKRIDCGEPIFAAPVLGDKRVYFATLGARVYAISPEGEVHWNWDFVKEVIGFDGDRWSGASWLAFRGDRVTWRDHFVCSREICLVGQTIVMPAGGRTVFLDDDGQAPRLRAVGVIPNYAGSEYPATFGQSADAKGNVYVQWHRRDNAGRVEIFHLTENAAEDAVGQDASAGTAIPTSVVPGTETSIDQHGLLSFASVSVRGSHVYRVKPEFGSGLSRHNLETGDVVVLSEAASICAPVLTADHAIYGGLDGSVHMVPLDGTAAMSIATPSGAPITAPLAIASGSIYVPCEDGYLYVLEAADPRRLTTQVNAEDLKVWELRNPLTGPMADAKYDWYTNYGDFSGTNANDQGLAAPLRMRWAQRLDGTVKHLPVCGGGRLYIHTAEGQVLAVEQDTGRLLWRRYWPDVYLSFTSPLYIDGKLIVPQAGIKRSVMRCLDAATGELIWEAPFTGSPSWSRQFPPVVHGNLAIYASGSGEYAAQGTEAPFTFRGKPVQQGGKEVMSWIYSNDNPYYPKNHRPRLWAWNLETGEVEWEKDFSDQGRGGNDCGICILDGKLFYSVFFGYSESARRRRGLPPENNGMTACLNPQTGEVIWQTNRYYVTSKCTLSAREGKIYIGGFNRAQEGTDDRFVWCLDATDGSLIWQSDPVTSALNVVTVGPKYVFSNALRGKGNVFDRKSGAVIDSIGHNYACCRFTLSEPFVLGANMDMIDLSRDGKLVSTGPAIDSRECLGAVVSNGRVFYFSQASGFVVSQTFGKQASKLPAVWQQR